MTTAPHEEGQYRPERLPQAAERSIGEGNLQTALDVVRSVHETSEARSVKKYFLQNNLYSMTKHTLTASLPDLPEEFSIDELIERLLIVEKIEKGRHQYREGKTLTSDEVAKRMEAWGR